MNTAINWDTYKFHPSSLKNLMVEPRLKSESLSETTKSFLNELYIEEVFGRKKTELVANKYVRKGTMCETDGIQLLERVSGITLFKNNVTLENEYLIGTPDIRKPKLIDIKNSWDLFTFFNVDEDQARKDYYWQLLGYMILENADEASLAYTLVDVPEILVRDEEYRLCYYMEEEEAKELCHKNYTFGDIPEELRVKTYTFLRNEEDIAKLLTRIELSRMYLKTMGLKPYIPIDKITTNC